jgi:2-hydroxy-3-keto-5-methylthiopentenyl-1-phosphate phosphatase
MPSSAGAPVLFLDFDNTITAGDVLDRVIERFSASDGWRDWEAEWQAGQMSTHECLRRQVSDLRASPEELRGFMSSVIIDPAFRHIVAWAAAKGSELCILSDNFSPFIAAILEQQGLSEVPVFANELVMVGGRLEARFPFRDPGCLRCAHCKAQHLRSAEGRPRIYVGDGLSDLCPSLVADVVFAKDSLAAELGRRGVPFQAYGTLEDLLRYLEKHHGDLFGVEVVADPSNRAFRR